MSNRKVGSSGGEVGGSIGGEVEGSGGGEVGARCRRWWGARKYR